MDKKPFIVNLWDKVFFLLSRISFFQLIQRWFPEKILGNYFFVEVWVVGHVLIALISVLISRSDGIRWWETVLLSYGGLRIFEIVVYQVNVLLFDKNRNEKAGREYRLGSYRRMIILLMHNYVEIVLWFALFYRNFNKGFSAKQGVYVDSFITSIYYSIVTMSTLGYGDITPIDAEGQLICLIQTSIGVFFALFILARFVAILPKPASFDEKEN